MIAVSCYKLVVVCALALPAIATNAPWGPVPPEVDAAQLKQAREWLKQARATRASLEKRVADNRWLKWDEARAQRRVTELIQPTLRFHMPYWSPQPKTKIWD